jgi:spoIIIJ-associated protein
VAQLARLPGVPLEKAHRGAAGEAQPALPIQLAANLARHAPIEQIARHGPTGRTDPREPDINAVEVDYAATIVDDLLRIFDIETEISIREPLTPGDGLGSVLAVIDIKGEDLGLLIGRRGDTLIALQYLVNLMLGRKYPGRGGVTIDVEHYKHRNEERIMNMAQRMGDRVRETGNSITLEPMSAAERRLVHVLFADDAELETNSVGEGENRKVVISLK